MAYSPSLWLMAQFLERPQSVSVVDGATPKRMMWKVMEALWRFQVAEIFFFFFLVGVVTRSSARA
jgi:hypothetical protein